MRVEKTIEDGFPDSLVSYRVNLDHFGRPPIVVDARTVQVQHLMVSATRLPNADIAWIINRELVCEELRGGVIACDDFAAPCCSDRAREIRCTCERGQPDQIVMPRASNRGR
ncbi:MAG: hypothetical protein QM831_04415 [Kofleriaceae bacterium]